MPFENAVQCTCSALYWVIKSRGVQLHMLGDRYLVYRYIESKLYLVEDGDVSNWFPVVQAVKTPCSSTISGWSVCVNSISYKLLPLSNSAGWWLPITISLLLVHTTLKSPQMQLHCDLKNSILSTIMHEHRRWIFLGRIYLLQLFLNMLYSWLNITHSQLLRENYYTMDCKYASNSSL